jgi:hypothetical protein
MAAPSAIFEILLEGMQHLKLKFPTPAMAPVEMKL